MRLVEWQEGKARLLVPDPAYYGHSNHMPVFFNPRARVSRDVSTLLLSILPVEEVLDAMCATGVRGIRYALEAEKNVVLNDVDLRAVELAKKNAKLNGLRVEITREDANVLMHTRTFDAIDIDPFGTPAPFLHAAARSVRHGGVLLITATDTAPLFGAAPRAAIRKYLALTRRVEWEKEMGVRILLANVFHALGIHEKGMIPIISFVHEHHVRVIVRVFRRPSLISSNTKNIGLVDGIGPLWLGPLHDRNVVRQALARWTDDYSKEAKRILQFAEQELQIVGYHDIHAIARSLRLPSVPSIADVLEQLRSQGFRATRTLFSPTALKTDAPRSVVEEIVSSLTR